MDDLAKHFCEALARDIMSRQYTGQLTARRIDGEYHERMALGRRRLTRGVRSQLEQRPSKLERVIASVRP
jgi:hypothetical protein